MAIPIYLIILHRHTTATIILVFLICMSFSGIQCTMFYTRSYRDPLSNITRYIKDKTNFYINNRRVIDVIVHIVFNFTVPSVALVVVTAATFVISVRMRSVLAWRLQSAHVSS